MLAIKSQRGRPQSRPILQRGAAVIEFALIVIVFFTFIFGIIELARLMFAINTLQESTRRAASAAATSGFANSAEMDNIRRAAIFRDTAGFLSLMPEVSDQAIRIDYMSLQRSAAGTFSLQQVGSGALPETAAQNQANCLLDPYGANCVQLVRVRVCDPTSTDDCKPINFKTLTSLVALEMPLPLATTIVRAHTLGLHPN